MSRAPISGVDWNPCDAFEGRHIGPNDSQRAAMLEALGYSDVGALLSDVIPESIRGDGRLRLEPAHTETEILADLRALAARNQVWRSFIGRGYHGCLTPSVIQRNILENPAWYTQYTPYQSEISQGRLEALLNYQTMVCDLTGLPVANSSLLDEATAAAEAMTLCERMQKRGAPRRFFVSSGCHPQTIEVVRGRAAALGIEVAVGDASHADELFPCFGVLLQYPDTRGDVACLEAICEAAHGEGALVVVATDLLALTVLRSPGSMGADVAVGNSQRFGVPLGFGGPHAAFMSCRESFQRRMPGRIVGVSRDTHGAPALRLSLQTREQHIRRDRATSNICTAQVLLAVMASMYAVYHGPEGLKGIAWRVRRLALGLRRALVGLGYRCNLGEVFDTLSVTDGPRSLAEVEAAAMKERINLRHDDGVCLCIALDETVTRADLEAIYGSFGGDPDGPEFEAAFAAESEAYPAELARREPYMQHPVFSNHHTETDLLRYIHRLAGRDLSLTHSMIPLGSCTMKLNATTEMVAVSWPEFAQLHPFAPLAQARGYLELFRRLEADLAEITGFAAVSLQPNAGSQGEYAGLLTIRAYHEARGDLARQVCLIPSSAHGTNPASAILAGMKVVVIACDKSGNIDLVDLAAKAEKHRERLAALMVTYPSTHGVFEESIGDICAMVHAHGGQVYLDGANMNALVGLCKPAEFGADVCHLNLHKTFCIPHGGGGPGMGPIGVAEHLEPYLPGHRGVSALGGDARIAAVSAAPWGSPSILPISYAYIRMMGAAGLRRASEVAILSANYIASRLDEHFPVLYRGHRGRVAHECIIDLRDLRKRAGIGVEDVAKRLMDYGFHAPTMSWPVPETLMIEPTESESLAELDRFCDALIAIREEIAKIESGVWPRDDNPLVGAPHTLHELSADTWTHAYSRELAGWPRAWLREGKFWPAVGRVDNVYGDRNLVCSCPPMSAYSEA